MIRKFKLICPLLFVIILAVSANAAEFVVNSTANTNDGICDVDCTLRDAITAAGLVPNGSIPHDIRFSALFDTPQTIYSALSFPSGMFINVFGPPNRTLTLSPPAGHTGPIVLFRGATGNFYNIRFADANNSSSGGAFKSVDSFSRLLFDNCLFENNQATMGGAIESSYNLPVTIRNSDFRNNTSYAGHGGAVYAQQTTTRVSNSNFEGNIAYNGGAYVGGGAIYALDGNLTVNSSTFTGNQAQAGSAIYMFGSTLGSLTNTTISNNSSPVTTDVSSAIARFFGLLDIDHVTVVNNHMATSGPALFSYAATTEIQNSIVALNDFDDISGVDETGPNMLGGNPLIGPLAFNGGPTKTHALLTGSPAIDAAIGSGQAEDQRGVARPQGTESDLGAFEKEIVPIPPLRIVTDPILPTGMADQAYLLQIVAADGNPPYSFALNGGALPTGMTLSNSGLLGGTPTQSGNFLFNVTVTDSSSGTAVRTFQLVIQPPLEILTTGLVSGTKNQPYSAQLSASGGVPPYVFAQTGGALPGGISLSSSGLISGTPTASGSFSFQVTVTDSHSGSSQRTLILTVYPALDIYNRPRLPTGITNQSYSLQLTAAGGASPYSFSLESGTFPNGLSLSSNGVISGMATQTTTASVVVKLTDSFGNHFQKQFRLTISNLYVVTTDADTNDGVCDAHCSLREAVTVGDSIPGSSNLIAFSAFFDSPTRIFLSSPISIKKTTEIRGKGRNKTFIGSTSPNVGPKFLITGAGDTLFSDLQLDDGGINAGTRSIQNESTGKLTIENSVLQGSFLTNVDGGALLQTAGDLEVQNSTFRDNFVRDLNQNCTGKGSAIAFSGGSGRITNSTFKYNASPIGSVILGNGLLTVENSTFSYNGPSTAGCHSISSATLQTESGSISILNSTVFDNAVNGAASSALKGNINIRNSIIAGNHRDDVGLPSSPNIGTGVISDGHNLIGFAPAFAAGSPNANGDYVGTSTSPLDPLLLSLAMNGGETETHALLAMSLAINNGSSVDAPAIDQRGVARPQGTGVDIGAYEADIAESSATTPTGTPVRVQLDGVAIVFSNVTGSGTTTALPILAEMSGNLPGGYSFGAGLPAFQITTTAEYTAPVRVCIQVSSGISLGAFNSLQLLHNENGMLVDRTFSRDFGTKTICAQTTSLSPFAVVSSLAPTASNVSISGRVFSSAQRGLPNAVVSLTGIDGQTKWVRTGSFGYYQFDDVEVGGTVILSVGSKRYSFEPKVITLSDALTGVDFVPLGTEMRQE